MRGRGGKSADQNPLKKKGTNLTEKSWRRFDFATEVPEALPDRDLLHL